MQICLLATVRTEDVVLITPDQTEKKASVLVMGSIHAVLQVDGAAILLHTVKPTFIGTFAANKVNYIFNKHPYLE